MEVWQKLRELRRSRKKYVITLVLLAALVFAALYGGRSGLNRPRLVYSQSLDEVAAVVNGSRITFRDAAVYVEMEEAQVERAAYEYNPDDPKEYWNIHVNNVFIRVAARNAAIQMAIHDEIFSRMAEADGIVLDDAEEESLARVSADYWSDLEADGKAKRLGVTRADVEAAMRKMAYAQKYQAIYAQMEGASVSDYDFGEAAYEELLKTQKYEIRKDAWGRVDFGNVTIVRGEQ